MGVSSNPRSSHRARIEGQTASQEEGPGQEPGHNGRTTSRKKAAPVDRSWVPKVFVPLFLLGVLWLIVYYIAGNQIPGISNLGDWNILIGMGLMAAGFGVATLWK